MPRPTAALRRAAATTLSHLDPQTGNARMVDVGAKTPAVRRAVARATVRLGERAFDALLGGGVPKGDALATARLAAVSGAKQTASLVPLCHPLLLSVVRADLRPVREERAVEVTVEAVAEARTGVEMEALTGASVAALTLYDMCKSASGAGEEIVIEQVRLLEKSKRFARREHEEYGA